MKKILGIGNAIVDIVSSIDDDFLKENFLIKGSMSLIDEGSAQNLSRLSFQKITCGGSAANTITAMAQLGAICSFIGKVGMDDFGKKFISEIENSGVHFISQDFSSKKSAQSFILLSPDAQRTMCTYLGCASEITEDDIKLESFKDCAILYLEGYLWDQPQTISALKKAISLAKKQNCKIAFTLSDLFCVARHKQDFLDLIKNDLDILFANENEIKELLSLKDIEENNFAKLQEFFISNKNLTAVITRSDKGCAVFQVEKLITLAAEKIDRLVDTTGAGDCFAAGFLFGIINNFSLEKSAHIGNFLASKIIQKIGARFEDNEIKNYVI